MNSFPLFGGQITLYEGAGGYRPSEDSLWLAWCLPLVTEGARVCDVGCGTGAVGFAYQTRAPHTHLYGFDLNPTMVTAAQKAAPLNAHSHQATFAVSSIKAPPFAAKSFDLTFANPPFFNPQREQPSANKTKEQTRFYTALNQWLATLADLTVEGGWCALIVHKADVCPQILQYNALNLTHWYDLTSKQGRPPKRSILIYKKTQAAQSTVFTPTPLYTFEPALRKQALGSPQ